MIDNEMQGQPEGASEVEAPKKMLTQEEVDRLIGAKKAEAFEKGRKAALAEISSAPKPINMQDNSSVMPNVGQHNNAGVQVDEIMNLIAAKQKEAMEQAAAQKMVNDFYGRIKSAENQFPGLMDRLQDLNLAAFPEVVDLAMRHENTAAIMDELDKNPARLVELKQMAYLAPKKAQASLEKLVQSIKTNQDALTNKQDLPEPFNQITHSAKGPKSREMSINDFKNMFKA